MLKEFCRCTSEQVTAAVCACLILCLEKRVWFPLPPCNLFCQGKAMPDAVFYESLSRKIHVNAGFPDGKQLWSCFWRLFPEHIILALVVPLPTWNCSFHHRLFCGMVCVLHVSKAGEGTAMFWF